MKGPTDYPMVLSGYERIEKADFDKLARDREFADGPFIESFGDGYGDPYNPHRTIWGTLNDGRKVQSST